MMRAHVIVGLFVAVLGIAGLAVGDLPLLRSLTSIRQPLLDSFFVGVTYLGDAPGIIAAALGLWAVNRHLMRAFAVHLLLTWAVSFALKTLIGRPRPRILFDQLHQLDHLQTIGGLTVLRGFNSFPSGHTLTAFALAGFLSQWTAHRPLYIFLWLGLAMCVGLSRLYLLNHYATDVAAGALIGWLIGYLCYKLAARA